MDFMRIGYINLSIALDHLMSTLYLISPQEKK